MGKNYIKNKEKIVNLYYMSKYKRVIQISKNNLKDNCLRQNEQMIVGTVTYAEVNYLKN